MKHNIYLIACVALIAGWVALAMASVGSVPTCSNEPYTWSMPLLILGAFVAPAALGYWAGRFDGERS